ncbi:MULTISPECIES: TonB-dependent receptor [unclassified Haematospirillum]|uniref:TonB-dependent receptor n=1 Tax=unclassified Haematospirillum TaxID=2622088 RepID=UPI00143C7202|nr:MULTISPECIES: TonB-dependent receptor [unclassified Haematospirillum]NKD55846.1 TonB-dependent receptor [Haematospirillum sp. H4890]NKD75947.1 TonB-dependent receptor [Haematospirillum sp. H4485]
MTFRSVLLPGCGSLVALALASHAWAQTSGSPAHGSAPAAARLGTVTVSAKRSVALQDVSNGITVLSHEELESAGVRSVTDLGRVIPGFSADRRGNSAYTGLSLRGLAPLDYYTPSVVVYVDGVPQDASLMEQSLSNVERIEVLKGPQGTLYGKNAYAGVINIVTKKPGNTMSGYVKTTVAKLGQGGEAHITSPLVKDHLYASITARGFHRSAQSDYIPAGLDKYDDGRDQHMSGRLRYAPVGGPLDIGFGFGYDKTIEKNIFFKTMDDVKKRKANSKYKSASDFSDDIRRHVHSASLDVGYDFGTVALKSITGLQKRNHNRRIVRQESEAQDSISQELRLAFEPEHSPVSGVAGVYAEHVDFKRNSPILRSKLKTKNYAVFGEATWEASDRLSVTAGGRYAHDVANIDYDYNDGAATAIFRKDDSWGAFTPKAAVNWKWSEDLVQFASISRGYKAGGFNRTELESGTDSPYSPEKSWNYEMGLRSDFLDRRAHLSGSIFMTDIDNAQIYTGPMGRQALHNGGEARVKGAEVEARANLIAGLVLSAGASVSNSKFTSGPNTGKKMPHAPEWSANTAISYYHDVPSLSGSLVPRLGVNWYGKSYMDENNKYAQGSYSLVNARLSYESEAITVSAFVDNLFDKAYRVNEFNVGDNAIQAGDGRNIGLEATIRF